MDRDLKVSFDCSVHTVEELKGRTSFAPLKRVRKCTAKLDKIEGSGSDATISILGKQTI